MTAPIETATVAQITLTIWIVIMPPYPFSTAPTAAPTKTVARTEKM